VSDDRYTEPAGLDGTDHDALVARVTATAGQGPAALRRLWDDLVELLGADATSRLWQEGLAESDASQQT
jgi:hypothetical protein